MNRIRYGSDEGQEFAAQVIEFIRFHTMKESMRLAKERGAFKAIQGSVYDPKALKWTAPKPIAPYRCDFGRPPVDWTEIAAELRESGIRNAAQLTIAPTGTIATVIGCEGYGCEPVRRQGLGRSRIAPERNFDGRLTEYGGNFQRLEFTIQTQR